MLPPEYSIFMFGDGFYGMVQGPAIITENDEGEKIVEITIKPGEHLRKAYDIKTSELDVNGNINIKAKQDDIIILNPFDDSNKKWLYIKNYRHEDTEISKFSYHLRVKLGESQKRIVLLEGWILWYSEQLQLAKTNPVEFVSQGFEMFERMSDRMIDMAKTKKEKEDYGK